MDKRFYAIAASMIIVVVLAMVVASTTYSPLPKAPISGAAVGPGWKLERTAEVENGHKWMYINENGSLDIRIREFDTEAEANKLYVDIFMSDDLKLTELFPFTQNSMVAIFHAGSGKGPWLVLVAQDGNKYLDMAYANQNGYSYDGKFEEDKEWLKDIAEQIF